jgi:hypothetical protein
LALEAVADQDEMQHLLDLYGGSGPQIMARLDGQLALLAGRAQTLLSLAGLTITVTGFSGTSIAKTSALAGGLCVGGLVTVLVAAALVIVGILRVRWTTTMKPCALEAAILHTLGVRNRRTRVYSAALVILVLGLSMYVASVALLVLHTASLPR